MAIKLQVLSLQGDNDSLPGTYAFNKDVVVLGRGPGSDVSLEGEEVSEEHARICMRGTGQGAGLTITDYGSTNGTAVNNVIIAADTETAISVHDRIIIGKFLIKAEVIDSPQFLAIRAQQARTDKQEEFDEGDAENGDSQLVGERLAGRGRMRRRRFKKRSERMISGNQQNGEVREDGPVHGIFVTISGTVGPTDVANVDFSAVKLLKIAGVVLHKGNPLPGVVVDGGELGEEFTDENGRFEFEDVSEHTEYSLDFSKDKFIFKGERLQGSLTDDLELTLEATELFTISGRIEHNGRPLVGVVLDGGRLGESVTNSKGEYFFYNVPEGTQFEITPKMDGFKIDDNADDDDDGEGNSEEESPIEMGA